MTRAQTSQKTKELNEGQMVNLVRNALLVAGHEMGDDGDHWPVIKSTIHQIMQDWETVKTERAVDAELKIQLYTQLEIMENELPNCTPAARAEVAPQLKELREIYDAYFSELDEKSVLIPTEMPNHIKRAEAIISTLEAEDEE